jgi:glycosyltransferase involved in cell wall biosynthesis
MNRPYYKSRFGARARGGKPPKVALVHYWLVSMRGGEKVLEALCELFPQADIYTHVYDPTAVSDTIRSHKVCTTFIQKLPAAKRLYKKYLPLMPMALEELDLTDYDIVISCEAGPAKGVITRPGTIHICYCHSPMRYLWDQYHLYRKNAGLLTRLFMSSVFPALRVWDVTTASRVDHFVANSQFVADRIKKFYRRDATVIHPPVAVDKFTPSNRPGEYYLCAGQMVRYKRFDLAIEAFARNGKRLVVAGTGEEAANLSKSKPPNVEFLGRQTDAALQTIIQGCRALIFPGEEDFGIVPVEAMACGRPVIAYGAGGVLESVIDGTTGVFFHEQTVDALNDAIARFEQQEQAFSGEEIRKHAGRFGASVFKQNFAALVAELTNVAPQVNLRPKIEASS